MKKMNTKLLSVFSILFFFSLNFNISLFGQCYESLGEMSGIDVSSYQSEIEAAACSLRDALPQEYRNDFKVFDFGYYMLNESMGEVDVIWDATILESQSKASYYVLFGKLSNNSGIYNSYRVSVSMPPILDEGCADNLGRKIAEIENILSSGTSPFSYVNKAVESLEVLESFGTCEICDNYDQDGNPIDDDGDGFANCDDFDCMYLQLSSNLKGNSSDLRNSSTGCVVLTQEELDIFNANEDYIVGLGYESSAEVLEEMAALSIANCIVGAIVSVCMEYTIHWFILNLAEGEDYEYFSTETASVIMSQHGLSIAVNAGSACIESCIPLIPSRVKRAIKNLGVGFATGFVDAAVNEFNTLLGDGCYIPEIILDEMDWGTIFIKAGSQGIINLITNGLVDQLTGPIVNAFNSSKSFVIDKIDRLIGTSVWIAIKNKFNLVVEEGLETYIFVLRNHFFTNSLGDKWSDYLSDFGNNLSSLRWFYDSINDRVKAWDKLFSNQTWRTNTGYLTKINRYTDEGIDIVEEGGKIKAKTSNGLEIGDLDVDALEEVAENALKVKGKFSGRHFDPDKAGGVIVRKSWQNVTINQAGIDDVITHTSRFDDFLGENAMMIDRLQKIKNGDIPITDFDKRYYTHELEEYARYKNSGITDGVDPGNEVWNNAHSATLEVYSITDEASLIYH